MSKILSKKAQSEEKTKKLKKYKCPYCELRLLRTDMAEHIEKYHEDLIPKGFTANRVAFNSINKKETGHCVMCKRPSPWNEDKLRYDKFCGRPQCKKAFADRAEKNTGQHAKMSIPEYQNIMLKGRSISGEYKFADGSKIDYVGSYEKKFLEFMDKVLRVKSEDIEQPGPVIKYEFEGKEHLWITDYRYIPYNLVFDIKDGGNNPNTRPMENYRKKQDAKEKAIAKQKQYNYIRATNNEFDQIFEMMAELRDLMVDIEIPEPIVRIHEDSPTKSNMELFILPPIDPNNIYLLNYNEQDLYGEIKNKYAICKDYMEEIVCYENDDFQVVDIRDFNKFAKDVKCYKYIGDFITYEQLIYQCNNDKDFYRVLSNKEILYENQIEFDPLFEDHICFIQTLDCLEECIKATAYEKINNNIVTESYNLSIPSIKIEEKDNIVFGRDINGIFVMNEMVNLRSPSFKNDSSILYTYIYFLKSL